MRVRPDLIANSTFASTAVVLLLAAGHKSLGVVVGLAIALLIPLWRCYVVRKVEWNAYLLAVTGWSAYFLLGFSIFMVVSGAALVGTDYLIVRAVELQLLSEGAFVASYHSAKSRHVPRIVGPFLSALGLAVMAIFIRSW